LAISATRTAILPVTTPVGRHRRPDCGDVPSYSQEWEGCREHCWRMRERLRESRYRMETAPPWEQDRLGTRLHEICERLRHECWGHWREDE
jgi:hypothetical protein